MDFAFYYFLNFYIAVKNPDEGERRMSNPIYQKKISQRMMTLTKCLPSSSIKGLESQSALDFTNLEQRIRDSHYFKGPNKKKEKLIIPVIKPYFLKKTQTATNDDELKQMDDNEIIGNLTNFTGVMNLWYSMSLQDRFFLNYENP